MIKQADYTLRITSATPLQLVVINYELIIAFLQEALQSPDDEDFRVYIDKAKNGLQQLVNALNLTVSVAQDLYTLYVYANQLLNTAFFSHHRASAAEALDIFRTLLVGWHTIAQHDLDAKPVMENTAQVYAGLTYQKDGLSEYVLDSTRSYQG